MRGAARSISLLAVAAPLCAAATGCIFFVDASEGSGGGGAGGAGTAGSTTAASTGSAGGADSRCDGAGIKSAPGDVLSGVTPVQRMAISGSGGTYRLFTIDETGRIRGYDLPFDSGVSAAGDYQSSDPYEGAVLAPLSNGNVLVTHVDTVFEMTVGGPELAHPGSVLHDSGGFPIQGAAELGDRTYVASDGALVCYGDTACPALLSAEEGVGALTATHDRLHWAFNDNTVVTLDSGDGQTSATFQLPDQGVTYPVFAARGGPMPRVYLRVNPDGSPGEGLIPTAFYGDPTTGELTQIAEDTPASNAVSAAFVGPILVVVTPEANVYTCCLDGASDSPPCALQADRTATMVAASPDGQVGVLVDGDALTYIVSSPGG